MADGPWNDPSLGVASPVVADNGPWNDSLLKGIGTTQPIAPAITAAVSPTDLTSFPSRLWGDIKGKFHAGTDQVRTGETAMFAPDSSILARARGLGETALGGMSQIASPISGASQAIVGDPARQALAGRLNIGGFDPGKALADTAELGANFAAPGLIASGIGKFGDAMSLSDKTAPIEPPASSDAMKQIASSLYKNAADQGGVLTPKFTNDFIDEAAKVMPQTNAGKLVAGESPVTSLIDRLQAIRDQPLTLDAAQEIDEHLGDLIDKEYGLKGLSKQGAKIADIQGQLRDMIASAGPEDVAAGDNGFASLDQGRKAWAQAMKMQDIERIRTRAELSEQPVTAIKSGIRTMLANPSRLRGYSPDEIAALEKASQTGVLTDVLRLTGSRLVPLLSMVGGAHGAALGFGVSTAARNAGQGLQMGRLNNVLDVMRSNGPLAPGPGGPLAP